MKTLIVIIIYSILSRINTENECDKFKTSQENCMKSHPNNINCMYYMFENEDICVEIIDTEECQYDANKQRCVPKKETEVPDLKVCDIYQSGNDNAICQYRDAFCYDFTSSEEQCLKIENCGYNGKKDYDKCFMIYPEKNEEGCEFKSNKCTSSSKNKFCELVEEEGYTFCRARDIKCSDLGQDSNSCLEAELKVNTNKCAYDSSRSSGNKCFEVTTKEGCTFDNENKKCDGTYASNGKICDLDYTENPVTCQKRNIQCNDFDEDETNCKNAKLPDKSKECNYNSENKCVEKKKEGKCNYEETPEKKCESSLPSKIICELKEDQSGCNERNVECADFESDSSGCIGAIISDSNKKCQYDSNKEDNKCFEVSKDCSDFYNSQECNRHKPKNSLAKCIWSTECKEKTCETTSIDNCGSFTPNDSGKQCSLNQDKTKCEEIEKEESEENGAENLKMFLSIIYLLIIF